MLSKHLLALLVSFCLLDAVGWPQAATDARPNSGTNTEATVTFYSGGKLLSSFSPLSKTHVFTGCIFEKDVQLACITWRRYAVVKLPPGLHIFSASLSTSHGAQNSQVSMLVETGKNYYLRTTTEHRRADVVPVPIGPVAAVPTTLHADKGFLEAVNCEVAAKDTADFAPADANVAGKDWARRPRDGAPACSQ